MSADTFTLTITPEGDLRGLYSDDIPYRELGEGGELDIRRASHVEPCGGGLWAADMAPVGGPVLGPFDSRAEALAAEVRWITEHVL